MMRNLLLNLQQIWNVKLYMELIMSYLRSKRWTHGAKISRPAFNKNVLSVLNGALFLRAGLVLGLVVCCFSFTHAKTDVYEHKLDNGLTLVYVPTAAQGTFCFGVMYNVGSTDDPYGKTGLSHFLEHMMFRGTRNLSADGLKTAMDTYDAKYNAYTGFDNTFFWHISRSDFFEMNLAIEADRMQNLKFADDDFTKERNVVCEERKLICESNTINKYVYDAMLQILFLYSPYKNFIGGYTWHIMKYDKESLMGHYKTYYSPNNATVVVVGSKFNDSEKNWNYIKEKVAKYFGNIPANPQEPKRMEKRIDPVDSGLKYVLEKSIPEIKMSNETIVYSFNSDHIRSIKDYYTLQVLLDMLFGHSVAYKIMVDEQDIVYSIDAQLWNLKEANNAFVVVNLPLKQDVDRKLVEQVLFGIVSEFKSKHATEDLLARTKKKSINQYELLFDDPEIVFRSHIVDLVHSGYSVEDISNVREIIESVTLDDILKMYDKVFSDKNLTHKIYTHPTDKDPNMVKKS